MERIVEPKCEQVEIVVLSDAEEEQGEAVEPKCEPVEVMVLSDSEDEETTCNAPMCSEDQTGGARFRVLNVRHESSKGRYEQHIKFVTLTVELQKTVTVDPRGPERFGDMIVDLVKQYFPASADSGTQVGITIRSADLDAAEAVGLYVRPISEVSSKCIVDTMAGLSQSSKSPLEFKDPKIDIIMKYVIPPGGSGQRGKRGKRKFTMEDVLERDLFGKRRRVADEGDDDVGNMFADEADEVDGSDESEEEEGEVDNHRSNIMKNDVAYDCLPHALFQVAMYHRMNHGKTLEDRTYGRRMYRLSLEKSQNKPNKAGEVYDAVNEMKKDAGVTKRRDFDAVDIEMFQKTVFAGTHQIVAIVKDQMTPYFSGPFLGVDATIAIYLDDSNGDGHYSGVRKLPALLGTKYYCALCDVRAGSISMHYNCPLRHRVCGAVDCPEESSDLPLCCVKCTVLFRSKRCLENHLMKGVRNGKSRCEHTRCCGKCGEFYYTTKNRVAQAHDCGTKWCDRCMTRRPENHNCVMMVSKKKEAKLTRKRIFFDFESRVDEETGEQVPVLFVALRCCPKCSSEMPENIENALQTSCSNCAPDGRCKLIECITEDNRFVNVAQEATEWLFSKYHKGFVALAHNASGYDAQFILKQLVSSRKAQPQVITAGTKIIYMKHKNVKLIDSLKYLTMSLAAVGKAFKIPVQKGDFPIHFIRPENYDYVGPLPADEYYNLEKRTPAARDSLLEFLEKARAEGEDFNFVNEIFKYCFGDVFILASALLVFEKDFEAMTNVCLFEESVTAASAAIKVFQRNHLDHYMPIVLDARPSVSIKSSISSQKYLAWFGETEKVVVEMSTTTGERKVGKYRVDGFVEPCEKYPRGLVIEFFGCYWHAHKCRYSDQSMIGNKLASEIRAADSERISALELLHDVDRVWECEVESERRSNPEMAAFFEEYEPMGILECERALVGGRTEVFRLYANNDGGVKLHYVDVVSLYPTVMKHESFPIGPPTNVPLRSIVVPITEPEQLEFRGFLSCRVLPPRQLRLPVIPIKSGGKLVFALCRLCAKTLNQQSCRHTDEERSFNGTYTTVELKKALACGYKVIRAYHGVAYEHWVENDENGVGGLFTAYINQMMVEKIYASGWPSNVVTEEDKKAFVDEYLTKEGIRLDDPSRFGVRHGARLVAKLLLNSLWGKFAQRVDQPCTEIVNNPAKFWRLFYNSGITIEDLWTINDTIMVRYRRQAETLKSLKTGAVHIAAYVTSYARLRLYNLMESVGGENIIYTDTDSIVYKVPAGCVDPLASKIGPFLGQLTNEVSGEMTEFVALAPKTYCYKESDGDSVKVIRKAKGISITSEADKKITFDVMKKMVDEVLANALERTSIQIPQHTMRRDKCHSVFSKEMVKKFRYTFNKRRVLDDGSTLPFGYCE